MLYCNINQRLADVCVPVVWEMVANQQAKIHLVSTAVLLTVVWMNAVEDIQEHVELKDNPMLALKFVHQVVVIDSLPKAKEI